MDTHSGTNRNAHGDKYAKIGDTNQPGRARSGASAHPNCHQYADHRQADQHDNADDNAHVDGAADLDTRTNAHRDDDTHANDDITIARAG